MKRLTDEAWADIARAYAAGEETVTGIAARHGIDKNAIYRRARSEGWPRRKAAAGLKSDSARRVANASAAGSAPRNPGERTRAALVQRLLKALDAKLKHLETSMKSGKAVSAADSERQTRQLNHLIRSFEKVTELARDRDTASGAAAPSVSAADAERMRAQIAERLDRLVRGREPRG